MLFRSRPALQALKSARHHHGIRPPRPSLHTRHPSRSCGQAPSEKAATTSKKRENHCELSLGKGGVSADRVNQHPTEFTMKICRWKRDAQGASSSANALELDGTQLFQDQSTAKPAGSWDEATGIHGFSAAIFLPTLDLEPSTGGLARAAEFISGRKIEAETWDGFRPVWLFSAGLMKP